MKPAHRSDALTHLLALSALAAALLPASCTLPPPPPPNACGGNIELRARPGATCPLPDGQDGLWRCTPLGDVVCANACGGDAPLEAQPNTPCERNGLGGLYTCNAADPSNNTVSCDTFNICGGDQPLDAPPGALCTVMTSSNEQPTPREGIVVCDRNDPLNNTIVCGNPCGGLQALTHAPGDPCGCEDAPNSEDLSPDQGVFACNGPEQLVCRASAEAAEACAQGALPDCYGPDCVTPYDAMRDACAALNPSETRRTLQYDSVNDTFLCPPEDVPFNAPFNSCGGTALLLNTSPSRAVCASQRANCNAPGTPCSLAGDIAAPDGIWVCSDPDTLTCVPIFHDDRSPRTLCEAVYATLPDLPEETPFITNVPCEGLTNTNDNKGEVIHCARRFGNVTQECAPLNVDRRNLVNVCGSTSMGLFSNANDSDSCGCGGTWSCAANIPGGIPGCIDQTLNACGGCDPLAIQPGTPCATSEGPGITICDGINGTACALTSEGLPNACGGTGTLTSPLIPGTPCGPCKDGRVACVSPNQVACLGATVLNECGGCGILPGREGSYCAPRHEWDCDTSNGTMTCAPDRFNVCSGTGALIISPLDSTSETGPEYPGTHCRINASGESGVFVCDSGQDLVCITAPP